MLRTALVVSLFIVPLSVVPLTVSLLRDGDVPADGADGGPLVLTEELLPAATGWFAVPIVADAPGYVIVESNVSIEAVSDTPFAWALLVAHPQGRARPDGPMIGGRPPFVEATSPAGAQRCCSHATDAFFGADASGGASYAFAPIAPGEVLYVGAVAAAFEAPSRFTIEITSNPADLNHTVTLTAGEPVSGERVELFDLVGEAYARGASVRLQGQPLAAVPGDVDIAWEARHTGFLALEAQVVGAARAHVRATLPNGTEVDNEPGREMWSRVVATTGPGVLRLELQDLHEPGPPATFNAGWSEASAWALLADIDVPHHGLHAFQQRTTERLAFLEDGPADLELNGGPMPGEAGWFVVPIEADAPGVVELLVELNDTFDGGGMQASAPIVAAADWRAPAFWSWSSGDDATLAVAREGEAVACCATLPFGSSTSASRFTAAVAPGKPVYVGLAAVGWSARDAFAVLARSDAPGLRLGPPVSGDEAFAVDPFEAAYDEGTNVRALGRVIAGEPGDVHREWTAERAGLVFLDAWTQGATRGRVSLELPGGRVHTNGNGENALVSVSGAAGPGTVRLTVSDVYRPPWDPFGDGDEGYASSVFLFADVDIPYRGVHAYGYDE